MTSPAAGMLDLSAILKAGDRVMVGCGAGEPKALMGMIVEQRNRVAGVEVLLGYSLDPSIRPQHIPPLNVRVLGGYGANRVLLDSGSAQVMPCHVSALPGLMAQGLLQIDVVFLQCSPANEHGVHSLGVTTDVLGPAIRQARVVVAEINDQMPYTYGDSGLPAQLITHSVRTSRPLAELLPSAPGAVEQAIAEAIAERIGDRSVLQLGIGQLPAVVAEKLRGHRDLGVHSGLIGDWVVDLVERGVVTNAFKAIDRGLSVGGVLMGSSRLYSWADRNESLSMREAGYTHNATVLGQLDTLVTVNSAIEVDLTGQVNAETANGSYLGAVGGQVDFVRAGTNAIEGHSIVALPSTAVRGSRSRIVNRLESALVTTPRTDVDLIVTEHGVAELRGLTLGERARRMIQIADPRFREELERGSIVS